jgi:glycosyltransferase involved in cell wall biosynthesis
LKIASYKVTFSLPSLIFISPMPRSFSTANQNSVSVIILAANRSEFLLTAIESVLSQTDPAIEIIVVDDGSNEDTKLTVRNRYPGVIYIHHPNDGAVSAKNAGIRTSKGEYVIFLDRHDYLFPSAIEIGGGCLQANPELGFAFGRYLWKSIDSDCADPIQPLPDRPPARASHATILAAQHRIHCATAIFRRGAVDAVGGFDPSLGEMADLHLLLRIARTSPSEFDDRIAVGVEDQKITYQELNDRANQLAYYLQNLGVKLNMLVGLCVDRSVETIVGILGILKAGGAYLPIDPSNPPERSEYILKDAQITISIATADLLPRSVNCGRVICLDTDLPTIAAYSIDNLVEPRQSEDLATEFYRLLASEQVTILNQTPSAFYQLINVDERLHLSEKLNLRSIIFGGEALNLPSDENTSLAQLAILPEDGIDAMKRVLSNTGIDSVIISTRELQSRIDISSIYRHFQTNVSLC